MKLPSLFILSLCALLLSGCSSYKKVPYLQDSDVVNSIQKNLPVYKAKIMPNDLLTITVNTTDPEVAAPFNLTVQSKSGSAAGGIHRVHDLRFPQLRCGPASRPERLLPYW